MAFTLDKVVPWGRSYQEYLDMFRLTEADLGTRILGCGDGPASFNTEFTARGGRIVSVDPIYAFSAEQIRTRVAATYQQVIAQLQANRADYVWDRIASVEELGRIRMAAMDTFLADFEAGKREGRYIAGELPTLPFESAAFDLALSSHFLFLYSDHLSLEFHIEAIREMLRVAREVRVFPLLTLDGRESPYLQPVINTLRGCGFEVERRRVRYEFQKGGSSMLAIRCLLACFSPLSNRTIRSA